MTLNQRIDHFIEVMTEWDLALRGREGYLNRAALAADLLRDVRKRLAELEGKKRPGTCPGEADEEEATSETNFSSK